MLVIRVTSGEPLLWYSLCPWALGVSFFSVSVQPSSIMSVSFSQVCHSPGSQVGHPSCLTTRSPLLKPSTPPGTLSEHSSILMLLSRPPWGPGHLSSNQMPAFSTLPFSSGAFLLGISSDIPESFLDFCQILHSRSRCWATP